MLAAHIPSQTGNTSQASNAQLNNKSKTKRNSIAQMRKEKYRQMQESLRRKTKETVEKAEAEAEAARVEAAAAIEAARIKEAAEAQAARIRAEADAHSARITAARYEHRKPFIRANIQRFRYVTCVLLLLLAVVGFWIPARNARTKVFVESVLNSPLTLEKAKSEATRLELAIFFQPKLIDSIFGPLVASQIKQILLVRQYHTIQQLTGDRLAVEAKRQSALQTYQLSMQQIKEARDLQESTSKLQGELKLERKQLDIQKTKIESKMNMNVLSQSEKILVKGARSIGGLGLKRARSLVANHMTKQQGQRNDLSKKPLPSGKVFKVTQLGSFANKAYKVDFIMNNIKLMHQNNLAFKNARGTLLSSVKTLVDTQAVSDSIPSVSCASSMLMHEKEICMLSMKKDAALFAASKIIHLQFDSAKKGGANWLAVGAACAVDSFKKVMSFQLGMIKLKDSMAPSGMRITAGCASSYANAIQTVLSAYDVAIDNIIFVVVDSCSTNVGSRGGVIALLGELMLRNGGIFIVHCLCHIIHNAIVNGIVNAWGKDKTKQRQGSNSPIVFFLEKLSSKVRCDWDLLQLGDGVVKCPECQCTRWNTYMQVAAWIMKYYVNLNAAIQENLPRASGKISSDWASVAQSLHDRQLMLQCTLLAEVGNSYTTYAFNWSECSGGFHAAKIHDFLSWSYSLFSDFLLNPKSCFPTSYMVGIASGYCENEVTDIITPFLTHFSDYFTMRCEFWHKAPFIFAAIGNDSRGPKMAQALLSLKTEYASESEFLASEWATLGLLTDPELLNALSSYATSKVRPSVLQEWWNKHFGSLPIMNARMESTLKALGCMPAKPNLYAEETVHAFVKIQMDQVWERYTFTDAELLELRTKRRALSKSSEASKSTSNEDLSSSVASNPSSGESSFQLKTTVQVNPRVYAEYEKMLEEERNAQSARDVTHQELQALKTRVAAILAIGAGKELTKKVLVERMQREKDPRRAQVDSLWVAGNKTMRQILDDIVEWDEYKRVEPSSRNVNVSYQNLITPALRSNPLHVSPMPSVQVPFTGLSGMASNLPILHQSQHNITTPALMPNQMYASSSSDTYGLMTRVGISSNLPMLHNHFTTAASRPNSWYATPMSSMQIPLVGTSNNLAQGSNL